MSPYIRPPYSTRYTETYGKLIVPTEWCTSTQYTSSGSRGTAEPAAASDLWQNLRVARQLGDGAAQRYQQSNMSERTSKQIKSRREQLPAYLWPVAATRPRASAPGTPSARAGQCTKLERGAQQIIIWLATLPAADVATAATTSSSSLVAALRWLWRW